MSLTSHIIPLLGLLLMAILLLLLFPGYLWQHRQRKRHWVLRHSISQYRLSKMLAFLGIELGDYLAHVPERIVLQQISECKACTNHRECDACLRDGKIKTDLHFCPNYDSLLQCSRMMPSAMS